MTAVNVNDRETEALLKGITLPPQPATLMAVRKEQAKEEPDIETVAAIVARDLSVSAGVLKTLSSPLFGLRREIHSIQEAVQILGLNNVVNVVTGLSLREAMAGVGPTIDSFFDAANDTALVAAALAKSLSIMPADTAYTLGLFQDCGMPLLTQRFPEYGELLERARAEPARALTKVEDERLSTNHAVVGYYLTRSWGLPADISQAISVHHRVPELLAAVRSGKLRDEQDLASKTALLALAEHFSCRYRGREESHHWDRVGPRVLEHFDITPDEYDTLREDIFDQFED